MTKETSSRRKGLLGLALAFAASQPAIAAVIEGRVTDGTGAVGLEGAIVEIEGTGFSANTDRTGNYRIVGVPAGDVNLTVSYLGADTVISSLSIASADATETLNFNVGDDVRLLDNVLVTGQRGALFSAINRQRSSDTLISVLTSDVIGTLPDENVAESARRIPGLSVQNDQGEGRFVTIRGLDPTLNAVSVNGVRLPAPDGDSRAVALDVIDSDVLSAIKVQKTLTPDFDGDGIGGAIDIETLSAFDYDELYLRVKAEGIYSEISEAWGEKVGVTAADTFMDGRLGIAGNVTYNRRDFGADNFEADGGFVTGGDVGSVFGYPEELEFRDYQIERERTSATLNFDFILNDSTDLYVRTLYNEFSDQEFRSRNEFKLEDAEFLGTEQRDGRAIAQFGIGDYDAEDDEFGSFFEVDRDIKDRLETQKIWSIQTGGETVTGALTWEYGLAYSYAEEAEPNRLDTDFRADTEDGEVVTDLFGSIDAGISDALLEVDVTDQLRPFPSGGNGTTTSFLFGAENFEFDEAALENGVTDDQEWAGFLNLQNDTTVFGNPGFWKTGIKVRLREKSRDVEVAVYDGFDGDDLLLSQFAAPIDYDLFPIDPVPNAGQVRSFFNANLASFELNEDDTLIEGAVSDFEAEENIYAAFVMGQTELQNGLTLTGGFRVEATDFSSTAFALDDDAEETFQVSGRQSFVDFLPSLVARYDAGEKVVLRAGYYRSIARPDFEEVIPAIEINEDLEGEAGNPDLERQVSDNWDAGIEFYPSRNTAFSASVFHKSINDYIATTVLEDVTLAGVTFTEVETPVNLTDASLLGVELSYQTVFDGLPSPFDGLLTIASLTLQEGDAEVNGRSIPLPNLSENVGSLIIGYDKYGLDLRAAISYQSEYLDDLNEGGDGIDRFEDDYVRIDFTAQYDITEQFEIQFEAQNLFDEPAEYFLNDSRRRLSQFEEYGRTFRFGVRYRY